MQFACYIIPQYKRIKNKEVLYMRTQATKLIDKYSYDRSVLTFTKDKFYKNKIMIHEKLYQ